MRKLLLAALVTATLAGLTFISPQAAYAKWPQDKQMTIVAAWPAGTGVDLITRLLANELEKKYNIRITVENRPGAAGNTGQAYVARQAPDGYTFIVTTPGPAANAMMTYPQLPYDPLKDFTNIAQLTEDTLVLLVGPKVTAANFKDFIAYAKANPGKVQLAHAGAGSYGQLAELALQELAGVEFNLVPYRGGNQMAADLLGKQIDGLINFSAAYIPQIEAGQLKALAVLGEKRSERLPNVPTFKELGINFSAAPWMALQGPKGIPDDIVKELNAAVQEALKNPELVAKLKASNTAVRTGSPQDLDKLITAEIAKWRPVIEKYGVKSE